MKYKIEVYKLSRNGFSLEFVHYTKYNLYAEAISACYPNDIVLIKEVTI